MVMALDIVKTQQGGKKDEPINKILLENDNIRS